LNPGTGCTGCGLNQRLATLFEQAGLKWGAHKRTVHVRWRCCWPDSRNLARAPDYRAFAIVSGTILGAIPTLYVMRKRRKHLRKFGSCFPDSLDFWGGRCGRARLSRGAGE